MPFGQYPDVSLVKARELHAEARKLLASGTDPVAARKAEKVALRAEANHSFRVIGSLWWEHWRTGKSKRHADVLKRRMENDVYPALGARPIAEIEATEIVQMVKQIEKRGASDLAKRAMVEAIVCAPSL